MQKSLLTHLSEAIDQYRQEQQSQPAQVTGSPRPSRLPGLLRWFLPNGGTLLLVAILIFTQNVWAGQSLRNLAAESAASTGTIAYQGRLANSSGVPITETLNMSFRLYSGVTGGTPLWTEQWTGSNGVKVSDGLFNVMLGSLTPIAQSVITGNSTLFLGITVGTDDEMTPRVQLGSVPFAVQALTVPDGSITTAKLAGDVSFVPPNGGITTAKIAEYAVVKTKVLTGTLTLSNLNFVAGTASIQGASQSCESYGGETHCLREVTVTHNFGATDYLVVTGTHHGGWAHRHTISIHSKTATTFQIRATNIVNNFWVESDLIVVEWLLIPLR